MSPIFMETKLITGQHLNFDVFFYTIWSNIFFIQLGYNMNKYTSVLNYLEKTHSINRQNCDLMPKAHWGKLKVKF
jgi:hypothetical protein